MKYTYTIFNKVHIQLQFFLVKIENIIYTLGILN